MPGQLEVSGIGLSPDEELSSIATTCRAEVLFAGRGSGSFRRDTGLKTLELGA
jgi:hypothetical protein